MSFSNGVHCFILILIKVVFFQVLIFGNGPHTIIDMNDAVLHCYKADSLTETQAQLKMLVFTDATKRIKNLIKSRKSEVKNTLLLQMGRFKYKT